MSRIKANHPRKPDSEYRPDYSGMFTYPETREVRVTNVQTGNEAVEKITVQIPLNRAGRRLNGARGEALQGIATLAAGFPQKRAMKRVSGGRLTGAL